MKLKDQIPSENVDDNPSGWMSRMKAKLTPDQTYKTDPPAAIQATGQHSDKMTKSHPMESYVNRKGKGSIKRLKSGGGRGW